MKYLLILLVCSSLFTCDEPEVCPLSDQCLLEPDPGVCYAMITRYYYDPIAKECKEFIWGGCDGVVPFETLEACKSCECSNDK